MFSWYHSSCETKARPIYSPPIVRMMSTPKSLESWTTTDASRCYVVEQQYEFYLCIYLYNKMLLDPARRFSLDVWCRRLGMRHRFSRSSPPWPLRRFASFAMFTFLSPEMKNSPTLTGIVGVYDTYVYDQYLAHSCFSFLPVDQQATHSVMTVIIRESVHSAQSSKNNPPATVFLFVIRMGRSIVHNI